ncbi:hypothetical protein HanIR_Chr06g0261401 [Helianthus annuus]|nr:hypothetical protein HanIR_Chr06g0261401 [Helianthus annuus]
MILHYKDFDGKCKIFFDHKAICRAKLHDSPLLDDFDWANKAKNGVHNNSHLVLAIALTIPSLAPLGRCLRRYWLMWRWGATPHPLAECKHFLPLWLRIFFDRKL